MRTRAVVASVGVAALGLLSSCTAVAVGSAAGAASTIGGWLPIGAAEVANKKPAVALAAFEVQTVTGEGQDRGYGIGGDSLLGFGDGRLLALVGARTHVGFFGDDYRFARFGGETGLGVRLSNRFMIGATGGYDWGGFPQNGHTVFGKAMIGANLFGVNAWFRTARGRRFGTAAELPPDTSNSFLFNTNYATNELLLFANGLGYDAYGIRFAVEFADNIQTNTVGFVIGVFGSKKIRKNEDDSESSFRRRPDIRAPKRELTPEELAAKKEYEEKQREEKRKEEAAVDGAFLETGLPRK